mgnify:CR=1 FL=1
MRILGLDFGTKTVGVAVSDSPTGPFVDPIGKPLVSDDMTDNGARGWWNDIDPTALIDQNGQAWLCWGNGTCFMAKLKPNMIELDGEIKVIDLPGYVEGPYLHYRNGIYYLTYAGMGKNFSENIQYATATSMEGPWTPQGELTGAAENSFTIHPAVVEYKDKWYLFYHDSSLSGGVNHQRCVMFREITYNEDVAKLSVVGAGMMSNPGVAAKMFEALYNSRININMISTSEIRITVLVDEKDVDRAVLAVHDEFVSRME